MFTFPTKRTCKLHTKAKNINFINRNYPTVIENTLFLQVQSLACPCINLEVREISKKIYLLLLFTLFATLNHTSINQTLSSINWSIFHAISTRKSTPPPLHMWAFIDKRSCKSTRWSGRQTTRKLQLPIYVTIT
jgi:hypothetical protein